MTDDVLHEGLAVGPLLDLLLAANPTNQMAFEYVMAHHLLELDLKSVVDHLRFLDNFHYAQIPRPYEEAILLFQQLSGAQVNLRGRAIRLETVERFRQFKEAVRRFQARPEDLAAMAGNFGDTYWYYYYVVRSRERSADNPPPAP